MTTTPEQMLRRVRLELARDHEFPDGSRERGYDLVAPLDAKGHIDFDAWKALRDRCRVRRFWAHEREEIGGVGRVDHRERWIETDQLTRAAKRSVGDRVKRGRRGTSQRAAMTGRSGSAWLGRGAIQEFGERCGKELPRFEGPERCYHLGRQVRG